MEALNGDVVFRFVKTAGDWQGGSIDDTLNVFTPTSGLDGVEVVSTGFSFLSGASSQAFDIGIRYGTVPSGLSVDDIRVYQRDTTNGKWIVLDSIALDTANRPEAIGRWDLTGWARS